MIYPAGNPRSSAISGGLLHVPSHRNGTPKYFRERKNKMQSGINTSGFIDSGFQPAHFFMFIKAAGIL